MIWLSWRSTTPSSGTCECPSAQSRQYCLEMICADLLAGANLANENPEDRLLGLSFPWPFFLTLAHLASTTLGPTLTFLRVPVLPPWSKAHVTAPLKFSQRCPAAQCPDCGQSQHNSTLPDHCESSVTGEPFVALRVCSWATTSRYPRLGSSLTDDSRTC